MSNVLVEIEQQNAVLANPVTPDPKNIRIDYSKNNQYEPRNIMIEDLSVEVTALKIFTKELLHIVRKLFQKFLNYKHPENKSLCINSKDKKENRAKTLIIKQLTDTKPKINPASMLVSSDDPVQDTTTQYNNKNKKIKKIKKANKILSSTNVIDARNIIYCDNDMNRTVQMQQLKMEKKTKTDAFQKLEKGHFRKERKKITLKKSQIEATAIMEIIKIKKSEVATKDAL